jgi:CBS domain-containing protein
MNYAQMDTWQYDVCKSLTDWIKQYDSWMTAPGEKNNNISSIFFMRAGFGDQKLEDAVQHCFYNCKNNSLFFDYLGNDALRKIRP